MNEHTVPAQGSTTATVILLTGLTASILAASVLLWALVTDDLHATAWTFALALWIVAFAAFFLVVAGFIGRLLPPWRQR